jgi:hypothetical protein
MGATYTRQSNFTDGDVITADLFNNEFDQLLAALASSTGHTHDGTAAEGGPISKLLADTITIGTAAGDISLVFDGGTNDGTLKWMEDEDYFEFSDDILIATTEKIQFTNTSNYIHSASAGNIDLVAATEIHLTATTINMDGAADISGNLGIGGNLTVTGTTTFNGGTITLGDAATDNVVFAADVDSSIIPDDDDTYDLGSATQEWRDLFLDGTAHIDTLDVDVNATVAGTLGVTGVATVGGLTIGSAVITEAELEILDGATVTTTELNIIDGDTSASSTTVVDADRVVLNDNGTMVQVAVTDLAAYFDDEITAMPNLVTTAATTVGALNSGSITSGFGTINNGSSTITTTGLISGGSLDIDNVLINGTTIGHTDDTDLITLADGVVTVAGEISMTTLDIGGTNVTSTATELNLLDGVSGLVQADFTKLAAVDSTAAELNIVDGNTSATSTTVVDADRVVLNDNGTMVQVAVTDLAAYLDDEITAMPNLVTTAATTVGALDSGSITSGFGTIDTGASAITTTGLITGGSLTVDDVGVNGKIITMTGSTSDTATFTVGTNGTLDIATTDDNAAAANIQITADGTAELAGTTVTLDSSGGITLNADSGTITFADDSSSLGTITSSGYSGTAAVATTVTITDNESTNENNAIIFAAGADQDGGNIGLESDGTLTYNPSTGTLSATNISVTGTLSTVDSVTMSANNAVVFEGATADAHETTLTVVDATADRTITLPNQSGTVPVLAAASNTAVTSTPEELNIMDGGTSATSTTIVDADRLVLNDNATMVQVAVTDVDTYVSGTTKTLTNKTLTTPVMTGPQVKNGATSAGFIQFFEDSDNGTNKVTLIGPASTADVTLTLPAAAGIVATTDDATALAIALG